MHSSSNKQQQFLQTWNETRFRQQKRYNNNNYYYLWTSKLCVWNVFEKEEGKKIVGVRNWEGKHGVGWDTCSKVLMKKPLHSSLCLHTQTHPHTHSLSKTVHANEWETRQTPSVVCSLVVDTRFLFFWCGNSTFSKHFLKIYQTPGSTLDMFVRSEIQCFSDEWKQKIIFTSSRILPCVKYCSTWCLKI